MEGDSRQLDKIVERLKLGMKTAYQELEQVKADGLREIQRLLKKQTEVEEHNNRLKKRNLELEDSQRKLEESNKEWILPGPFYIHLK